MKIFTFVLFSENFKVKNSKKLFSNLNVKSIFYLHKLHFQQSNCNSRTLYLAKSENNEDSDDIDNNSI